MAENNSKEIIINDLPDCYAKECLQNMVKDSSVASVYVVAVVSDYGDWACYVGFPSLSHIKDVDESMLYYCSAVRFPSGVASNGDKINKEAAIEMFPEYSDLKYRY